MGSGSTRLRTKVIALLASLVALWSFAAWVTVADGFNLLWVQTLDSQVAEPGSRWSPSCRPNAGSPPATWGSGENGSGPG